MDGVKIYGLCIERLKYQIALARKRPERSAIGRRHILLESYNTNLIDDIVDILELYDLEDKSSELLREKLEDLAYTVSVLTGEKLSFDYNAEGHLGLYLSLQSNPRELAVEIVGVNIPAAYFA